MSVPNPSNLFVTIHNWHMPTYRDQAVVLRTQKLGEADRIVTLLTREHGKVRTVAKGVRKSASRFGARLEPLNLIDVQLHTGRSMDTVTQVETVAAYGANASADYALWTSGQAMVETADRLTPEEREPATQQFLLLVGGLKALIAREHEPSLILDAYLIRSMSIAGWAASFDNCARCDEPGPHHWFSVSQGGALCETCRVPGSATPALETMVLLGALLSGDWHVADRSDSKSRREATGLVAAHLQWHLEREVRSLKHVDRTLQGLPRAETP
jgi:DNA repair protein RecO (recombination protein O)